MKRAVFGLTLWVVLLVGCAANFDQKYAGASRTNDWVNSSTAKALNAEKISSIDAEYVLGVTDKNAIGIDAAKAAADSGDLETAAGRLRVADRILQEIESYLISLGVDRDDTGSN